MSNGRYVECEGKPLRGTWEFPFSASSVAEAADRKRKYHAQRIAWWTKTAESAEVALRKKGFEYRDREITGGSRLEVVADPELIKRISEARQKIKQHRDESHTYTTWIRALKTVSRRKSEQSLKLTIDDILFFGL